MSQTLRYATDHWNRVTAVEEGDAAAREWFGDDVTFTRTVEVHIDDTRDGPSYRTVYITYTVEDD